MNLYVGGNSYAGSYNTLTVSNAGKVFSTGNSYIGGNAGANSNTVTVTDTNSAWYNTGDLTIGRSGSSNTLTVANGGLVTNGTGIIGNYGTNNSVLVTGAGSVWSNGSSLYVGSYSGGCLQHADSFQCRQSVQRG